MKYQAVIIDIDMTLVDSSVTEHHRRQRNWPFVYSMIPQYGLHPDIPHLISELQRKGMKIAFVSSSPRPYCERILTHFKFPYSALVAYHDTQMHKPNSQPFMKALSLIQIDPSKCISLGDDVKDVLAAKASGLAINIGCIWHVDNSTELVSNGADFIATQPMDVIEFLDSKY